MPGDNVADFLKHLKKKQKKERLKEIVSASGWELDGGVLDDSEACVYLIDSQTNTIVLFACKKKDFVSLVWAGVLWGNDSSNDFFLNTHGIATPDYWWKVVIRMDTGEYVAWIMPNDKQSKAGKIDSYLVSIEELANAGAYLPNFDYAIPSQLINVRPGNSWPVKQVGNRMLECGDGFRTHMG